MLAADAYLERADIVVDDYLAALEELVAGQPGGCVAG
jgi:hypothetical protein